MTEADLKALKLNESLKTDNGERYTRTIGGWIYSNFAGKLLFIPDVENTAEERIIKKDVETVRKNRTTK